MTTRAPLIFIADDQRDVVASLRLLLKGEGYASETFTEPATLIEALRRGTADAVLMDLNYTRDTTSGHEGLEAIARMSADFPELDLILVESGGDNLAATFSPELSDLTIYVIDVAGGEKIPRKGGPGITRSDLLIINKTDLAPHVGANLEVMASDAKKMRGERPFVFTNLRKGDGVDEVIAFIRTQGLLDQGKAAAS